eukprot:jgi/Psemu1/12064/gm1.12064_g
MKLHNAKLFVGQLMIAAFCGSPGAFGSNIEKRPEDRVSVNPPVEGTGGLRGCGGAVVGTGHPGCSPNKKVTLSKFCIYGESAVDLAVENDIKEEHRLKLDGSSLEGYHGFGVDRCNEIKEAPMVVKEGSSLTIGTEKQDGSSWIATLEKKQWFINTCVPFGIMVASLRKSDTQFSLCLDARKSDVIDIVDSGATFCEDWTRPPDSFVWVMKVEPSLQDFPLNAYNIIINYPSFHNSTPTVFIVVGCCVVCESSGATYDNKLDPYAAIENRNSRTTRAEEGHPAGSLGLVHATALAAGNTGLKDHQIKMAEAMRTATGSILGPCLVTTTIRTARDMLFHPSTTTVLGISPRELGTRSVWAAEGAMALPPPGSCDSNVIHSHSTTMFHHHHHHQQQSIPGRVLQLFLQGCFRRSNKGPFNFLPTDRVPSKLG